MTDIHQSKVTLINYRDGQERFTRYTLQSAVEMIRTGILKSGKQFSELTELPRICFACAIKNKYGQQWNYIYNGFILLEINNLPDRKTAEEIRDEAAMIDYTMLAFVGADGRSVKLVCQAVERNQWQNPEGYWESEVVQFNLNAYAKFHYLYSTQLAIRVDNIPPSMRSSCLMSHDPDVRFNPYCATMVVSPKDQTAERLSKTVRYDREQETGDRRQEGIIPGLSTEASMRHEYQACKADALEECRLDKEEDFVAHCLEVLAHNCHESGLEEAFAVKMTLFDGRLNEDADYVQTVFDSQYSKTLKATWPLKHVKPSQLLTYKTEAFLNSRYELRKNVMTGVAQYRSKDSYDYRFYDLTKEAMNTMSIRALKAGLDSWDKDIKRYVESTLIPEFDPVNEWLEQLPKWDGKDRVTPLAERVKTDNPHWIGDFHKWMLSMVAHWKGIDRNHGNAIVPMLIGKQGCGKSAFGGMLLRYASFIATTNNLRPLPDDKSGSRRFICIVVKEQIDYLTPIDYPQLYAQLLAEIARGDRYWFEEDENQRIINENRNFERVGNIEKMIAMMFCPADSGDKSALKGIDEIVDILDRSFPNFHRTKGINVEVGRALNNMGYFPHKTASCQKYFIKEMK